LRFSNCGVQNFGKKIEITLTEDASQLLFAAGDVNALPFKQIVIAAGERAKAVLTVSNYLKKINNI
jgi:alkyl hydroperoxide reductase subunit AhpF